jgi:NADPH:quinone reductase-like Zn-dependent oxidoreductase
VTPGDGVVIDVKAAGISFVDLPQTRGEYQLKPELPFVPGTEVAVASAYLTFPLNDRLDFAGADHVVRSTEDWRSKVVEISDGGVDLVIDPVGGDRFTDSMRSLTQGGRLVVVGFSAGSIPEVKVNRLLLRNIELIGAAVGEFTMNKPELVRQIGEEVSRLVEEGYVRPMIGRRFPLERAAEALAVLDRREAIGKVVLDLVDGTGPAADS